MVDGSEEVKQAQGAEQPRDDLVMLLMSDMQQLQSRMSSIKGGHIAARSKQRSHDAKKVEADVMVECLIIKDKIQAVRATLQENINSPSNINGCLRGSIDEYLASFDAQIATLKSKFEDDRDYWHRQVQNAAKFEEVQTAKMMEHYRKFQLDISGCLTPGAYEIKGLKDLENFGSKLELNEETFRWPTVDDLEKLNLTGPLKLKEIRTNGESGCFMTAIQLVFEHGVESPLFEVKKNNQGPLTNFAVSDEPITSITALGLSSAVYKLEIEQGGQKGVVFNENRHDGDWNTTRQVPANHTIVGVYGRFEDTVLLFKLGFIVMEN